MKRLVVFVFAVAVAAISFGDQGFGRMVGTDPQGNAVVSGRIGDSVVAVKYSPSGEVMWSRVLSTSGSPFWMRMDTNGDALVSYHVTEGNARLSRVRGADGVVLWTRTAPFGLIGDIAIGPSNTVAFATSGQVNDQSISYIQMYAMDGSLLWQRPVPDDNIVRLKVDGTGAVYYTAYTDLVRLHPNGQGHWRKTGDYAEFLLPETDASNNLIVCGDPELQSKVNVLIRKYAPSGALLWTRSASKAGSQYVSRSTITPSGDFYVTGVDYEINPNGDAFVLRVNTNNTGYWYARYAKDVGAAIRQINADTTGVYGAVWVRNNNWRVAKFAASDGHLVFDKLLSTNGLPRWLALDSKGSFYTTGSHFSQTTKTNVMTTFRMNAGNGGFYWVETYP